MSVSFKRFRKSFLIEKQAPMIKHENVSDKMSPKKRKHSGKQSTYR